MQMKVLYLRELDKSVLTAHVLSGLVWQKKQLPSTEVESYGMVLGTRTDVSGYVNASLHKNASSCNAACWHLGIAKTVVVMSKDWGLTLLRMKGMHWHVMHNLGSMIWNLKLNLPRTSSIEVALKSTWLTRCNEYIHPYHFMMSVQGMAKQYVDKVLKLFKKWFWMNVFLPVETCQNMSTSFPSKNKNRTKEFWSG